MNQPIFGNMRVINTLTNKPWVRKDSPFSVIPTNKLITVADLYFNFDMQKYRVDPQVNLLEDPDFTLANQHFSTPSKIIDINIYSY